MLDYEVVHNENGWAILYKFTRGGFYILMRKDEYGEWFPVGDYPTEQAARAAMKERQRLEAGESEV